MSEQPDPILQAAARVLARHMPGMVIGSRITEAVVDAVTPLIRAQIADEISSHVEPAMSKADEFALDPERGNFWSGRAIGIRAAARIARGDAQ